MIRRITRLLSIALIVALCIYIVVRNSTETTVSLAPRLDIVGNTGVVMIGAFFAGMVVALLIAVYFGLKSALRERSFLKREKNRDLLIESMIKARGFYAAEEWDKCERLWEEVYRKDPTSILGRIELSKCLEGAGRFREAVKILEEARAANPSNIEILFQATSLHLKLNNKTAAIDNLALILCDHPNKKAARMARDLSEELNRIEDALEYHDQLKKACTLTDQDQEALERLHFKKLLLDNQNTDSLKSELKHFVRHHSNCLIAIERLAEIQAIDGEPMEAAELFERYIKAGGNTSRIQRMSELLIAESMPERALSKARNILNSLKDKRKAEGQIELIKLYLSLGMSEEAVDIIADIPEPGEESEQSLSQKQRKYLLMLEGYAEQQAGNHKEAAEIWKKLLA